MSSIDNLIKKMSSFIFKSNKNVTDGIPPMENH